MKKLKQLGIILFVLSFSIGSQFTYNNATAQTVSGIDPTNLSNTKIDDLTDQQFLEFVKLGQDKSLSITQIQDLAAKRGLPKSEIDKLVVRYNSTVQIKNSSTQTGIGVDGSILDASKNGEGALLQDKNKTDDNTSVTTNILLPIKIYGQEYFRNGNIKVFDKATDVKAGDNYIIGIGDEIGISVFGYSYFNEVLKVDSKGAINLTQIGPIYLKGVTYEKAKSIIKSKIAQYFDLSNNKLDITIAYSRVITVNIVGEVIKPGSYRLPAANTAFNALILAGGPSDIGTLRNIQVRRNGKTIKTLDIYAFLTNPNSKQEFYLEDNDYIVVEPSKKIISLKGEFKRQGKYELLPNENLNAVIKYAGELSPFAYKEKIQILRSTSTQIKIIDLNLDSLQKLNKDFILFSGDEIKTRGVIPEISNKVAVSGAINFPGDYNYVKGDRVLDLINKAGGLRPEGNINYAYVVRTNQDKSTVYFQLNLKEILANTNSDQNIELRSLDSLTIYSNNMYTQNFTIDVFGEVKNPSKYNFVPGMKLADALQNAGGLTIKAENLRIEISRLSYFSPNYVDGSNVRVLIQTIQLANNYTILTDEQAKIELQPFDQIFIRMVPEFSFQRNVVINGEVKYPGSYALTSKNEKISNLIKRSGGLTAYSFEEGATFYRPSLPGGFIVFKLSDVLKHPNSKYNFSLRDGDVINIPQTLDFISIRGTSLEIMALSQRQQINAPYVAGRRAKYYIKTFGNGFSKNSWRRKTYVVQPNEKINRTRNLIVFKIYPKVTKGSTIHVVDKPAKKEKLTKKGEEFNWNKFIENTMVKMTGVITLYILFKQLSN